MSLVSLVSLVSLPTSYWDQSLLSSLNSLLDPAWMKDFLIAALHGGDFSTNLFVEMLDRVGVQADRFGDSTGPLPGLVV